ncbi:triple tyrosine motif-containing protein [Metabacillus litoralis]|uniref:triple tyrosine motif-containing protein n=1 Tax=Metabacillus litoralis TaxID=152268 RepID=UPI00203C196C|nr:triple tyrosine motif-containing protein [Metabacillus litoralis]MCM3652923.1 hypothetical protein [Metabacillus litoralis]
MKIFSRLITTIFLLSTFFLSNEYSVFASGNDLTLNDKGYALQGNMEIENLSVRNGTLDLNGYTLTVNGYINLNGVTIINVNKGKLIIKGGLSLGNICALNMVNNEDYVYVGGGFTFGCPSGSQLTAGEIEIKGDFRQIAYNSGSGKSTANFIPKGSHKVVLSGNSLQTVTFQYPRDSYFATLGITKPLSTGYSLSSGVRWNSLLEVKPIKINKVYADISNYEIKNNPIIVTAEAEGGIEKLYEFWEYNTLTGKWSIVSPYSKSNYFEWKPINDGVYKLSVHVKDKNSQSNYDSYKHSNEPIVIFDKPLDPVEIKNITSDKSSPIQVNSPIKISVEASGGYDLLYKFYVYDGSNWTVLQPYSISNTYEWTPTKKGNFIISVHVRDKYSKNSYDIYRHLKYSITDSIQ